SPVDANLTFTFCLHRPQSIILDFSRDRSAIRSLLVNGRNAGFNIVEDHIVIERKCFKKNDNTIEISFCAGEQSLNRNETFLYTLLVPDRAHTLFPCFDQPNLKAAFTLSLEVPADWEAVSNTNVKEEQTENGRKKIAFHTTEPLSTYLFSFVAGEFQKITECRDGRSISLYHRETDPDRIAQTGILFDQVFASINWMEEYTAIPYPFAKYDFIILPGFQYGGMEHTGATLYNDKRMFLGEHPTTEELLSRMSLIAHETAHMWFGDYVTMEWFDDVWTKEVFANYFAAQMIRPLFPEVNHKLNDLREFYATAYSVDRTKGTHAIRQSLDNLSKAGLIYGNIIYDKAPIVMTMLVDRMGEEAFKRGIRNYLNQFAYGNATWEQLTDVLDNETPENLKDWSDVWISTKGIPYIKTSICGDSILVTQTDPFDRDIVWPQTVTLFAGGGDQGKYISADVDRCVTKIPLPPGTQYILPNTDGNAYGVFLPDSISRTRMLTHLSEIKDPVERMSLLMTLYENMLAGEISGKSFIDALMAFLPSETDNLIRQSALSYLSNAYIHNIQNRDGEAERFLLRIASDLSLNMEYRLLAYRTLSKIFTLPEITSLLYEQWDKGASFEDLPAGEPEMTNLAYEIMIRLPEKAGYIKEKQLSRITNPDRRKAFEFIVQATDPDKAVRDSFFQSLLCVENRSVEPWVNTAMAYLNHFLRQDESLGYIMPALDVLQEVQQTGDIFFPTSWISSCLGGHSSLSAADTVSIFLENHPRYEPLLRNKILQAAGHLPVR
ncbi:MAG: M1 family aminopeptidase, partial [Bacteroidales bacterium]|nr:M1 family aminopeptidase [Bacteroidales bacterium]